MFAGHEVHTCRVLPTGGAASHFSKLPFYLSSLKCSGGCSKDLPTPHYGFDTAMPRLWYALRARDRLSKPKASELCFCLACSTPALLATPGSCVNVDSIWPLVGIDLEALLICLINRLATRVGYSQDHARFALLFVLCHWVSERSQWVLTSGSCHCS